MGAESTNRDNDHSGATPAKLVFVSYNHEDGGWVRRYLVLMLRAANISYEIDYDDFKLGLDCAESMKDAVANSRHTLVVLTPNWINSDWTNFEADLAIEKDPRGEQRSLIVLILKKCQIPHKFRNRNYLDISDFDTRDEQMARLLRELGASEINVSRALSAVAEKSLDALHELMSQPEVEAVVAGFQPMFARIKGQLSLIDHNKKIHDCLQFAELPVEKLYEFSLELCPDESPNWQDADYSVRLIKLHEPVAQSLREREEDDTQSASWLKMLCETVLALVAAVDERRKDDTCYSAEQLYNLVRATLPRVNDRIVEKIREIPLSELAESLQKIRERLEKHSFDKDAMEVFEEFRQGVAPLAEVIRRAEMLIARHDVLQTIDNHVGSKSSTDALQMSRVKFKWRMLCVSFLHDNTGKNDFGRLPTQGLRTMAERVTRMLEDTTAIRDDEFEDNLIEAFCKFRDEAKTVFQKTDIDLRSICDDLATWIDRIESILEGMQNHAAV
jgi:hypothetical protein